MYIQYYIFWLSHLAYLIYGIFDDVDNWNQHNSNDSVFSSCGNGHGVFLLIADQHYHTTILTNRHCWSRSHCQICCKISSDIFGFDNFLLFLETFNHSMMLSAVFSYSELYFPAVAVAVELISWLTLTCYMTKSRIRICNFIHICINLHFIAKMFL